MLTPITVPVVKVPVFIVGEGTAQDEINKARTEGSLLLFLLSECRNEESGERRAALFEPDSKFSPTNPLDRVPHGMAVVVATNPNDGTEHVHWHQLGGLFNVFDNVEDSPALPRTQKLYCQIVHTAEGIKFGWLQYIEATEKLV